MEHRKNNRARAGVFSGKLESENTAFLFRNFHLRDGRSRRIIKRRTNFARHNARRAFPFGKEFADFINAHEKVFVIEQNRDAQFKSLMMIELGTNPEKLISVLNYDGTPITADNILEQIKAKFVYNKNMNRRLFCLYRILR